MLKIVYPICCGMDVHKSFLVACIASINEQGVTTYKGKRFCTFTGDLRRCATWLGENNWQGRVYGAYRDVLAPYLQHPRTRPQYCPCPPQVRQGYPGKENRQKGRQVVCGHLQARPGFWQLYPTIRYSSAPGFGVLPLKTHQFHHGRENRAQNCLTVSNIKLDDVFPDGFGKAATAITSGC